jgi:hypothetical protein
MMEYERCMRVKAIMDMASVYRGVCERNYFYKYVVGNSFKLAYIIRPYPNYKAELEDMLQMSLADMRSILKLPLRNKTGQVDTRVAQLKISLFKDLADRTRGSAAKKLEIDSKSMNVNVDLQQPKTVEEIDKKLQELQDREVQQIAYSVVADEKV